MGKTSTYVIVGKNGLVEFCAFIIPFFMNEYLVLFRNASAADGYLTTSEDMNQDMPKWQAWIGQIALQGKLVFTAPVRYEGSLLSNNRLSKSPWKDGNSVLVAGFVICKADGPEEVEEWSKTCPILKYPNSSVEIRPLIPFPTQ